MALAAALARCGRRLAAVAPASAAARPFFGASSTTVVGRDVVGNVYHAESYAEEGTGEVKERRWVDQMGVTSPFEYDESKLPVEWQAWLRHTRGDPPSEEECRLADAARASVAARAEALRLQGRDGPPPLEAGASPLDGPPAQGDAAPR